MMMLSGECVLVADGRRFEHCTCAMDEGDGSERNFGFLSALSDVLEMARTAQWVEIGFKNHGPVAIRLLAINSGVGLFAFADVMPVRVTLTSGRWVAVVEGHNSRDVCIRAEHQLREHGSVSGLIKCHVTGADRDDAAAITDYVTDVQLSMADLTDPLVFAIVIHTLELARLKDCHSRRRTAHFEAAPKIRIRAQNRCRDT